MKNKNDIIEKIISELGIHNKRLTIEAKTFLQDRYNDINQDKLIKEIIEKTKGRTQSKNVFILKGGSRRTKSPYLSVKNS